MAFVSTLFFVSLVCIIVISNTTPVYHQQPQQSSLYPQQMTFRPSLFSQSYLQSMSPAVLQSQQYHHDAMPMVDESHLLRTTTTTTGRDSFVAPDNRATTLKTEYHAFLLNPGQCEKLGTKCCGLEDTILCTCGSAPTCDMSFKNIHSYKYTVTNGEFLDVSGRYLSTAVTICNTGDTGLIFISQH